LNKNKNIYIQQWSRKLAASQNCREINRCGPTHCNIGI